MNNPIWLLERSCDTGRGMRTEIMWYFTEHEEAKTLREQFQNQGDVWHYTIRAVYKH